MITLRQLDLLRDALARALVEVEERGEDDARSAEIFATLTALTALRRGRADA